MGFNSAFEGLKELGSSKSSVYIQCKNVLVLQTQVAFLYGCVPYCCILYFWCCDIFRSKEGMLYRAFVGSSWLQTCWYYVAAFYCVGGHEILPLRRNENCGWKNLMVGGFHLEETQYEPDDTIKIAVNDTRCTKWKWNEFARYVQWPPIQGTCLYFGYGCLERVIFLDEHKDCQLVNMIGLYGAGSGIG